MRLRSTVSPHLPGPGMTLLGEGNMADTLVVRVNLEVAAVGNVVEVLDALITMQKKQNKWLDMAAISLQITK